jgi:sec-independent protein translocase protein TatA
MPFELGPVELGLILLIVAMLFGVGKLPEVFGAVGKGVREFRKESGMDDGKPATPAQAVPQMATATAAPQVTVTESAPVTSGTIT